MARVFELSVQLGPENTLFTVELWQSLRRRTSFKARIWESELFRLSPTFPQSKAGRPLHVSDDLVRVERPIPHFGFEYEEFSAKSVLAAVGVVSTGFTRFLNHALGIPEAVVPGKRGRDSRTKKPEEESKKPRKPST